MATFKGVSDACKNSLLTAIAIGAMLMLHNDVGGQEAR
jgi:hypothetical protein